MYSLQNEPEELKQQIEAQFMSPVDSRAADALAFLEEFGGRGRWINEMRQAWIIFIRSLWLRMPNDIKTLKQKYRERLRRFSPNEQALYDSLRKENEPATISEWFARLPSSYADNNALGLIPKLADSRFISELLMNWHWFVLDTDPRDHELMTSDRPIRTSALKLDDAYFYLPIGPRKLFWIVRHPRFEDHIRRNIEANWVARFNFEIVRGANELVIARTPIAKAFVVRNMATSPVLSHFEKFDAQERGPGISGLRL